MGVPASPRARARFQVAFVTTMVALGLGWYATTHEPFRSKMQPVTSRLSQMSRGDRVPTVPDGSYSDGSRETVAPKAESPHTGVTGGDVEGRKMRPA